MIKLVIGLLVFYQAMYLGVIVFSMSTPNYAEKADLRFMLSQFSNCTRRDDCNFDEMGSQFLEGMKRERQRCESGSVIKYFLPSACGWWSTAGRWGLSQNACPEGGCEMFEDILGDVSKAYTSVDYPWFMWNHFVCLFATIAVMCWYRYRQVDLTVMAADCAVAEDDYAVLLDNLPVDCRDELAVINFVHRVLGEPPPSASSTYSSPASRLVAAATPAESAAASAAAGVSVGVARQRPPIDDQEEALWRPLPQLDEEGHRVVVRVVFAFDIPQLSRDVQAHEGARGELMRRARLLQEQPTEDTPFEVSQRARDFAESRALRRRMHSAYGRVVAALKGELRCRAAFVIFRRPSSAQELLARLETPRREAWWRRALPSKLSAAVFPARWTLTGSNKVVFAQRAPPPSDVIWESFGPIYWRRILREAAVFALSAVIYVLVVFAMEKVHKWAKDPFVSAARAAGVVRALGLRDKGYWIEFFTTTGPYLLSMVLIGMNTAYPMMCQNLLKLSKSLTVTELRCSEMWRIWLFSVTNNVLLSLYVHAQHADVLEHVGQGGVADYRCQGLTRLMPVDAEGAWSGKLPDWAFGKSLGICADWYSTGKLLDGSFGLLVVASLGYPLVALFPPRNIRALILQGWYRHFENLERSTLTQAQLNKNFESPELDLPARFVGLLNLLMLGVTFMPIIPFAPGLMAFGACLFFWANKWFFLRRGGIPYRAQHVIGFKALDLVFWVVAWQPVAMALLLSPSVSRPELLWSRHLIPVVTVLLFYGRSLYEGLGRKAGQRLIKEVKPFAACERGHAMVIQPSAEWLRYFEAEQRISRTCVRCSADFASEAYRGEQLYHCRACEDIGLMYQLCSACGWQQRTGSRLKSDLPYERACCFFASHYWHANPLYRFFHNHLAEWIDEEDSQEEEGSDGGGGGGCAADRSDLGGGTRVQLARRRSSDLASMTSCCPVGAYATARSWSLRSASSGAGAAGNGHGEALPARGTLPPSSSSAVACDVGYDIDSGVAGRASCGEDSIRFRPLRRRGRRRLESQMAVEEDITNWALLATKKSGFFRAALSSTCPVCKERFTSKEELLQHFDATDEDLWGSDAVTMGRSASCVVAAGA